MMTIMANSSTALLRALHTLLQELSDVELTPDCELQFFELCSIEVEKTILLRMVDEGTRVVSTLDGDVATANGGDAGKMVPASAPTTNGDNVATGTSRIAAAAVKDMAYPSNNPFAASLFQKPAASNESKSDGFVLTSDLKLNFLTKTSEDRPTRNTGAVPKRPVTTIPSVSGDAVSVDPFVRPSSPTVQKNEDGKASYQNSTSWESNHSATLVRLKLENERLHREIESLQGKLNSRKPAHSSSTDTPESPSGEEGSEETSRIRALEEELDQAKQAIASLKLERKKLKSEKLDLLSQMKQLYSTLDDKEKELRDFIRNYEQRMRDNESSLHRLSTEREERERERWSLLRHARDEAERSLTLAAQLAAKDVQIQQLQDNLDDARRQNTGGCLSDQESLASMSLSRINGSTGGITPTGGPPVALGLLPGDRGSCSADSGVRGSSDRESGGATSVGGNLSDSTTDGPIITSLGPSDGCMVVGTPTITAEQHARLDLDAVSLASSVNTSHVYQTVSTPKDCSPSLSPLNAAPYSRSVDNSSLSRSVEQLSSPMEEPRRKSHHSRLTGRGGAWGSISRVFTRSRHRKVSSPSSQEGLETMVLESGENYRSWSPLTEEGYAEKLRLLREAATIPMERWRAPLVLAWLEIALGMPQYGPRCAENIKSGKVLLELSDLELECGLGITHPMHRKKLRLAIEEHRHPSLVRYPCIAQLGHTWVSSEWLPDLGLAQYADNFATNMVDARMLDHLSKKELEKFLGVTRKFHQASIVHGIHLLRMMKYDRQALAVRRHQCESVDADPLVWTNQRFIKWARNIDLCEYSDNLKDSGVHGALVVLEPSFNGDTMATALGIPPAKNIIRRHLAAELETLVLPARYVIFCQMEEYQAEVARAVNNVKHIQRESLKRMLGPLLMTQLPSTQDESENRIQKHSSSEQTPSTRDRTLDWKGMWKEGVSRYRDLVKPIHLSLENRTDPAYWRTLWRGSVKRRRGHVQPLDSPADSVVSDFNFRVSSPPDFSRRSPTQSLSGTVRRINRRQRRTKSFSEIPVA